MAKKCKHRWESFVNGLPDDEIEVETINEQTGEITGKHKRPRPVNFTGHCSEGPPHHMNIKTHEGFEYDGDIVDSQIGNTRVVAGHRYPLDEKGRRRQNGDEVWVGVKTGT